MIRIAFRLDDPSETSHQGVESGILDVLSAHQACATFAVIPFRMIEEQCIALSQSRARPLIEAVRADIIEVALHGHTHVRLQAEPATPSEFLGLPQDRQSALIIEGRAHLESVFGRRIMGFVPPWNSYDTATLGVLRAENFSYLSADRNAAEDYTALQLLPFTTRLADLPIALEEARRFASVTPVIVVVMHHYDFAETGSKRAVIDLNGFSTALTRLTQDSGVTVCRLADIAVSISTTVRPIRQHQIWTQYTRLRHFLPEHSFFSAPLWRGMLTGALGI